jgi:DNA-directed RNA polymerase specialized sigma24 family protein
MRWRVPDDQRKAIELHHLRGLETREVAQRMNRTVASVGKLLQRGLRALRHDLNQSRT